jgi:hypothetical protein
MAISTKLLRAMTTKGWSEYCMVEKKAITTLADELDALRAPKARTGEVQYQARLRDPHLPECNVWMNITEAGANSIREKHSHVYEVRELVERHATPKVGDLLEEKLKSMQQERFQAIDAAFVKSLAEQKPVAILHDDGHYTWHGDKPHDFNYAGWRMEVYAVPQTAKLEPLAWINPYALKCLQGNATAVCAPKGMREEDETIPLYSGPQSTNDVLNVADHALLAAGYVEAYEIILAFQPILRATTSGAGTPARSK